MGEFTEWQRELAGTRLQGGRWIPDRRPSTLPLILALGGFALGALIVALAAARALHHGA